MKYAWAIALMAACLAGGCAQKRASGVFEGWGYPMGEVITFASGLEMAVDRGDYVYVAAQARYPFAVYENGEELAAYDGPAELAAALPELMNDGVMKAVRDAANGKRVFVNIDGAMFGRGEMWVRRGEDGKLWIVAINPRS